MYYDGLARLLELSVFRLYSIPTIPTVDAAEVFNGNGVDYRGF